MFIDSHAHLDSDQLYPFRKQLLRRAARAGIDRVLTIGSLKNEEASWSRVQQLLSEFDRVLAAFGVHPHDADHLDQTLQVKLEQLLREPRVVALGEVGLDFYYENSPRDVQQDVFRSQLDLAFQRDLPVIIHTRDAEKETRQVLVEHFPVGARRSGVLHCFTGSLETAEACIERGFYFSIGGILTFEKAQNVRETFSALPLDRVLIETDCPYLAPAPFRGKQNEPAYIPFIAKELARLHGITLEEVARQTTDNFHQLFGP